MLLSVLFACSGGAPVTSEVVTEAWPEWSGEADDTADSATTPPLDTADMPPEPEEVGECDPLGCIELAEAVDRGFATIDYGLSGLTIVNDGPWPVCLDEWYTFLSPTSQDAVAGTTGSAELAPSDAFTFPYAMWGTDQAAWWCIEHNQYTSAGSSYTFQGERAPTRVGRWTNDASDEDGDRVEDHADHDLDDNLPQTQHNVWDYLAERSVFVVGRQMNWYEVAGQRSVEVTVVVTNLGREAGAAQVMEKLPPGWVASSLAPAPLRTTAEDDGSSTFTWSVELEAAIEPASKYEPTAYDVAELHYVLTYTGTCHGREIGFAPNVAWIDSTGTAWTSQGSPMVLECCDADDGFNPGGGNGGFGP